MNYNGANYYYIRYGQNDIIGILDSTGTQVVSYQYDTWGKLLGISGSQASGVGTLNPFRYRGYYYDTETGLYYLQSRYYDPNTGRYLNADGMCGNVGELGAHNMFAYCGNNPVNRYDDTGCFWKEIGNFFKGIGSAIVKIVATGYDGAKDTHWGDAIDVAEKGKAIIDFKNTASENMDNHIANITNMALVNDVDPKRVPDNMLYPVSNIPKNEVTNYKLQCLQMSKDLEALNSYYNFAPDFGKKVYGVMPKKEQAAIKSYVSLYGGEYYNCVLDPAWDAAKDVS